MRTTHVVLTLSTLLAPFAALGAETLYVAGPGGSIQKAIEERVVPGFEARTGAKVVYVPGSSSDTLAKVIAQEGRQDMSFIAIDSGPMARARWNRTCARLCPPYRAQRPLPRCPYGQAAPLSGTTSTLLPWATTRRSSPKTAGRPRRPGTTWVTPNTRTRYR